MQFTCWLMLAMIVCGPLGAQSLSKSAIREATTAVAATLDDWHLAAAQSEEERYFQHLAPEAVFVGIDEQERWSKTAFKKAMHPSFEAHQVWNFKASQRYITLSPSGDVAWFDELLDTTGISKARGAGVLVKDGQTWLIAQYTLSLPIPRASFAEVKQMIEAQKTIAKAPDTPEAKKPGSGK